MFECTSKGQGVWSIVVQCVKKGAILEERICIYVMIYELNVQLNTQTTGCGGGGGCGGAPPPPQKKKKNSLNLEPHI